MNRFIASLFTHSMEGTVPRMVVLENPIRLAAMSIETDTKRVYRDVPRLGKRYSRFKRRVDIPNRKEPWAFAAVSRDYDQATGVFSYSLGDVVTDFDGLPPGLQALEIPPATYAVFPVRPKNRFGWGIAIGSVKRYAYETWLPASEFEQGGIIDDFEYHDERSTRAKDPEIDLYVCVKDRSAARPLRGPMGDPQANEGS